MRDHFDRFAEVVHKRVSGAGFFAVCVAIIVAWVASYPLFHDVKSWQATIHSLTGIITLLLVALLENAARRDAHAAQEKLNTIAGALADLMDEHDALGDRASELREAVGLEDRASSAS